MAEVKALAAAYKPLMAMMNEMNKKNDEVVAETEGSEAVSVANDSHKEIAMAEPKAPERNAEDVLKEYSNLIKDIANLLKSA